MFERIRVTVDRWMPGDNPLLSSFTVLPCIQIMTTANTKSVFVEWLWWQVHIYRE